MSASSWTVPRLGHESLDLLTNVFENLLDRPAFFYELDLMLGQTDHNVSLEMSPLIVLGERLHCSPSLANIRIDMAKRLDRTLEFFLSERGIHALSLKSDNVDRCSSQEFRFSLQDSNAHLTTSTSHDA